MLLVFQKNPRLYSILQSIYHALNPVRSGGFGPQPRRVMNGDPAPFFSSTLRNFHGALNNYRSRAVSLRSLVAASLRPYVVIATQRPVERAVRRGARVFRALGQRRAARRLNEAAREAAVARSRANAQAARNAVRRARNAAAARAANNAARANAVARSRANARAARNDARRARNAAAAANALRRLEANKVHAIGLRLADGHLLTRSNFVTLQRNLNAINTALLSANKRANYNRFAAIILEELTAGANQPNISDPRRNLLNTVRRLSQGNQRAARLAARRYERLYHNLPANLRHLL